MNKQLEKEIKDFVNAIFIRGEKDAIEYAASFIQTKQREAFEAAIGIIKKRKAEYSDRSFPHSAIRGVLDYVVADIKETHLSLLTSKTRMKKNKQ